jgi:hypothetical protein
MFVIILSKLLKYTSRVSCFTYNFRVHKLHSRNYIPFTEQDRTELNLELHLGGAEFESWPLYQVS